MGINSKLSYLVEACPEGLLYIFVKSKLLNKAVFVIHAFIASARQDVLDQVGVNHLPKTRRNHYKIFKKPSWVLYTIMSVNGVLIILEEDLGGGSTAKKA